MAGQPKGRE